jgi:hypothetical protein
MKPFSYDLFEVIKGKDLRHNFEGWDTLERNYSECLQDVFVMAMLDGKKNGAYLEVGSDHPTFRSNTKLLQDNGWTGISFDINEEAVKEWNLQRATGEGVDLPVGGDNRAYAFDATKIDYQALMHRHYGEYCRLTQNNVIDYLQLDCDPPEVSYQAMLRVPWNSYQFRVITYEHDVYFYDNQDYRELSRKFLSERGYMLVAPNISPDEDRSRAFEDWWVYPELIDKDILRKMVTYNDDNKTPIEYLLGHV